MGKHTIFFDARCLQDPDYKYKSVARHSANLCRRPSREKYVSVACCSRKFPPLSPEHEALFDQVIFRLPRNLTTDASIVSLSPMTHGGEFGTRSRVGAPQVRASLIYDFVPWDHHGYLKSKDAIEDYCSKLESLGNFELFFPVSQYSARRLAEIRKISSASMTVTGIGVDDCFYQAGAQARDAADALLAAHALREGRYIVFVGDGDPRGNVYLAVELAGRYAADTGDATPLVIAGHTPSAMRDVLKARHQESGGQPDGVVFLPHVPDDLLAALYRRSLATLAPSLIEGFPLPVAEAVAAGAIALVSDCDAHLELIQTPETVFRKTSVDDALAKLKTVAHIGAAGRADLLARQGAGIGQYRETAVRERFWSAIDQATAKQRPAAPTPLRGARPRVAFATPWPPQRSGVAAYTFNTVKAILPHADVDVYCTVAPEEAIALPGARLLPMSEFTDQDSYDHTYSVIGNSHFHTPMIEHLLENGGTAIIHDSRLFEYYFSLKGGMSAEFFRFAKRMIGRDVAEEDIHRWLQDVRTLPDLFLGDVIRSATDIVVHHPDFVQEITNRYQRQPVYIPFAVPQMFKDSDIEDQARRMVRRDLGLSPDSLAIAVFGYVDPAKGITESIFALGELRAWNVPAELYFVGNVDPGYKEFLIRDAQSCGVGNAVHFFDDYVSDDLYRKFLAGADCGIQLRRGGFGQGSGAVAECAAAGMPTVASKGIANSVEAPSYIRRVPDVLRPLLIAEQIINLHSQNMPSQRISEERHRYVKKHSFSHYAKRLLEVV